ncbi:hypothetical protein ACMU_11695 [Actibacterium mucosum KCTC 23349]|uniref:ROK family transcriptional regulator n=1 Tax=Actibacterium mucosum KCTC 23349 TaxID=1454373 RepID=A0A037ZIH2_9RHOB|nr:ROK family transcriptional regulator [Actibacterium mucosum]KAJ55352.1 hypothetical protein ACMU_11695 [Actibacterium mucosum KCTC 23349]
MTTKTLHPAGANPGRSRSHNRQMVLGHVRRAGQIGRAEIARASGLSTQAVSNIIADLAGDGLLLEGERVSSGRGLPAVQYSLNPAGGYALGVEIRPDVLLVALLDLNGDTVFSRRTPLVDTRPEEVTAQILTLRKAALTHAGGDPARLMGAGIVMPGPFGTASAAQKGLELPEWSDIDANLWFTTALDLPVFVENDANAAAMAERNGGAGEGVSHYAYLYFGAGLGLGIVTNGQLMQGAFGNAGEIGHITVPSGNGAVVLEQAVSRLSLQAHLAENGIAAATSDALAQLYDASDPHLMGWLNQAAEPLTHAITTIENLCDPQTIILGGAMPDQILDHLIVACALSDRSVSNRDERELPRLMRGRSGRMSATQGAAALVLNHSFTPRLTPH